MLKCGTYIEALNIIINKIELIKCIILTSFNNRSTQ